MNRETFSFDRLHPNARDHFRMMADRLEDGHRVGACPVLFKPFEGFRGLERQAHLRKQGVSKAGPWQSAHNYGLAVDFVPYIDGRWTWETDHWNYLRQVAVNAGLVNALDWDRAHVEHPIWLQVKRHLI